MLETSDEAFNYARQETPVRISNQYGIFEEAEEVDVSEFPVLQDPDADKNVIPNVAKLPRTKKPVVYKTRQRVRTSQTKHNVTRKTTEDNVTLEELRK